MAPTKKTAKAEPLPGLTEEETETILEDGVLHGYTREQLEELNLNGLKEVAAKVGIELPPRTRMATYIEAILGNAKDEEVEVTDLDVDDDEIPQATRVVHGTPRTTLHEWTSTVPPSSPRR